MKMAGSGVLKSSRQNWGMDDETVSGGMRKKKRVMVVVDESSHSKQAMIWALTHVTNKGDSLTLLHIVPLSAQRASSSSPSSPSSLNDPRLAPSLGSLCRARKPQVVVEVLVIQGEKLETVMSQVHKLDVSVLVLGQKRPSLLRNFWCGAGGSREDFAEECINNVGCLTIGVKKQRKGMGGYLISTRFQKNFWQLA